VNNSAEAVDCCDGAMCSAVVADGKRRQALVAAMHRRNQRNWQGPYAIGGKYLQCPVSSPVVIATSAARLRLAVSHTGHKSCTPDISASGTEAVSAVT